jgi:hypothetical protein
MKTMVECATPPLLEFNDFNGLPKECATLRTKEDKKIHQKQGCQFDLGGSFTSFVGVFRSGRALRCSEARRRESLAWWSNEMKAILRLS